MTGSLLIYLAELRFRVISQGIGVILNPGSPLKGSISLIKGLTGNCFPKGNNKMLVSVLAGFIWEDEYLQIGSDPKDFSTLNTSMDALANSTSFLYP